MAMPFRKSAKPSALVSPVRSKASQPRATWLPWKPMPLPRKLTMYRRYCLTRSEWKTAGSRQPVSAACSGSVSWRTVNWPNGSFGAGGACPELAGGPVSNESKGQAGRGLGDASVSLAQAFTGARQAPAGVVYSPGVEAEGARYPFAPKGRGRSHPVGETAIRGQKTSVTARILEIRRVCMADGETDAGAHWQHVRGAADIWLP